MHESPAPDPRQAILDELERMAFQDPDRQEEWLAEVAQRFQGHPEQAALVAKFRAALGAMRAMQAARAGLARAEELLEAESVAKLDAVLSGSQALPDDLAERTRFLLYISMAGHFLPNVRARLDREDAQRFLRAQFAAIF